MQTENNSRKEKFKAGLLGILALMNKLHFAKKVAQLVERAKFGTSRKWRHRHTYAGPAGHTLTTKKFVGSRSASRRARNFLKYHRYSPWARSAQLTQAALAPVA
jgi:hypothetical protein